VQKQSSKGLAKKAKGKEEKGHICPVKECTRAKETGDEKKMRGENEIRGKIEMPKKAS